jgi:hypothetical protein
VTSLPILGLFLLLPTIGVRAKTGPSQVPLGLLTLRSLSPDASRGADAEREGGAGKSDQSAAINQILGCRRLSFGI